MPAFRRLLPAAQHNELAEFSVTQGGVELFREMLAEPIPFSLCVPFHSISLRCPEELCI